MWNWYIGVMIGCVFIGGFGGVLLYMEKDIFCFKFKVI